jgi:hypothetical protein
MKKQTDKQIEAMIKSEWKKLTRGTPLEGMGIKEAFEYQQLVKRESESEEAFEAYSLKVIGLSPVELKKKEADPDWRIFWALSRAKLRDLNDESMKKRLLKAIEQNDFAFFIRLGNELKRKPRVIQPDRVEFFLASRWSKWVREIPPLCYFTDDALVKMLRILTSNKSLTLDQVRKTRQRLKLKTKDILIKDIEIVGHFFKFILVDKVEK